jgi:hypothetical protein
MERSSRMQWPFPSEDQDPWYEAFQALIDASDTAAYAGRENTNIVLMKGGELTFDAATDTLTWEVAIEALSPIEGFLVSIIGASGPPYSLTVTDGQVIYFNIVRAPSENVSVQAKTGNQVPNTNDAILLGIRRDDKIYFRDGKTLDDGQAANIFEEQGSGGGGSTDATLLKGTGFTVKFADLLAVNEVAYISNSLEVAQADSDFSDNRARVAGIWLGTGDLQIGGVASCKFVTGLTMAGNYGYPVYLSSTPGKLTLTPPTTGVVSEVGILVSAGTYLVDGSGVAKVLIQIKSPIIL